MKDIQDVNKNQVTDVPISNLNRGNNVNCAETTNSEQRTVEECKEDNERDIFNSIFSNNRRYGFDDTEMSIDESRTYYNQSPSNYESMNHENINMNNSNFGLHLEPEMVFDDISSVFNNDIYLHHNRFVRESSPYTNIIQHNIMYNTNQNQNQLSPPYLNNNMANQSQTTQISSFDISPQSNRSRGTTPTATTTIGTSPSTTFSTKSSRSKAPIPVCQRAGMRSSSTSSSQSNQIPFQNDQNQIIYNQANNNYVDSIHF